MINLPCKYIPVYFLKPLRLLFLFFVLMNSTLSLAISEQANSIAVEIVAQMDGSSSEYDRIMTRINSEEYSAEIAAAVFIKLRHKANGCPVKRDRIKGYLMRPENSKLWNKMVEFLESSHYSGHKFVMPVIAEFKALTTRKASNGFSSDSSSDSSSSEDEMPTLLLPYLTDNPLQPPKPHNTQKLALASKELLSRCGALGTTLQNLKLQKKYLYALATVNIASLFDLIQASTAISLNDLLDVLAEGKEAKSPYKRNILQLKALESLLCRHCSKWPGLDQQQGFFVIYLIQQDRIHHFNKTRNPNRKAVQKLAGEWNKDEMRTWKNLYSLCDSLKIQLEMEDFDLAEDVAEAALKRAVGQYGQVNLENPDRIAADLRSRIVAKNPGTHIGADTLTADRGRLMQLILNVETLNILGHPHLEVLEVVFAQKPDDEFDGTFNPSDIAELDNIALTVAEQEARDAFESTVCTMDPTSQQELAKVVLRKFDFIPYSLINALRSELRAEKPTDGHLSGAAMSVLSVDTALTASDQPFKHNSPVPGAVSQSMATLSLNTSAAAEELPAWMNNNLIRSECTTVALNYIFEPSILGGCLNMSRVHIFEANNEATPQSKRLALIDKWISSNGSRATWKVLYKAFLATGDRQAAEEIKSGACLSEQSKAALTPKVETRGYEDVVNENGFIMMQQFRDVYTPSQNGKFSPESQVMRVCAETMRLAIQNNLITVAGQMFSCDLISFEENQSAMNEYATPALRAAKLISALGDKVNLNSGDFLKILEVFANDPFFHSTLRTLIKGYFDKK